MNDTLYLIPPILNLVLGLGFVWAALSRGRFRKDIVLFALVSLWWTLLAPSFISHHLLTNPARILQVERRIHFIYVYLPAVNLLFFHQVLGVRRPFLIAACFGASFLISLFTPTSHYFSGFYHYPWGAIAKGEIFFHLFGVYGFAVFSHILYMGSDCLQKEPNPVIRVRIRYLLLSFCMAAVLTFLNMPAMNGINLYPPGNFIFIPLLVLAYGMLRHNLMDVGDGLRLVAFWVLVSTLFILPNFSMFKWFETLAPRSSSWQMAGTLGAWFALNLACFFWVFPRVRRLFFRDRLFLSRMKNTLIKEISHLKNVNDFRAAVIRVLRRSLAMDRIDFFTSETDPGVLRDPGGVTWRVNPGSRAFLAGAGDLVDRNLLSLDPEKVTGSAPPPASELFPDADYSYLIPLFEEDRLLGVIFFSEKRDGKRLTFFEVRFLKFVRDVTTIAFMNSRMYQRISNLKDDLEERTRSLQKEIADRMAVERALRESEKKYRLLAENVMDVIWIFDLEQNVFTYVSPSVERVLGFTQDYALGKGLEQAVEPESLELAKRHLTHQLKREIQNGPDPNWSVTLDLEQRCKNGSTIWTEVTMGFLRNDAGKAEAVLGITRDVTERRMQALQAAKVQAEKANQAKSEFLANMSHELRTPLNHIIGFTELVKDGHYGELNATQNEFLGDVLTSSRHLLSLINDILDLSKVEAGRMTLSLSRVDLVALLKNSFSMIRERAIKHGIELLDAIDGVAPFITADERKVKQIVYNLLSNAVKFTPDGGAITLSARMLEDSGPAVEVAVSDTGAGLKSEDLERVFGVFEQVDNSLSRNFEGTGLGLALTRRLVELHGGRIRAESKGLGKGSRFVFQLPVRT